MAQGGRYFYEGSLVEPNRVRCPPVDRADVTGHDRGTRVVGATEESCLLSVQSQMVILFESSAIYSYNNNINEHFTQKMKEMGQNTNTPTCGTKICLQRVVWYVQIPNAQLWCGTCLVWIIATNTCSQLARSRISPCHNTKMKPTWIQHGQTTPVSLLVEGGRWHRRLATPPRFMMYVYTHYSPPTHT